MYKIGEVANLLNVEKVVIFEKLISKSKDIEAHIVKEKGITYFTDFGVEVMNALIYGLPIPEETKKELILESTVATEDLKDELDEDYISSEDIKRINEERARIKKEIMVCRNNLIAIDGQHVQLDEALKHYQEMIKEDLDWIRIAEGKLTYRLNHLDAKG